MTDALCYNQFDKQEFVGGIRHEKQQVGPYYRSFESFSKLLFCSCGNWSSRKDSKRFILHSRRLFFCERHRFPLHLYQKQKENLNKK